MVKGAYILMEDDRELTFQFLVASQVVDVEVYDAIMAQSPLLASLMMKKFKQFLDNKYFTPIERQTILIQFLEAKYPYEIISDVLNYLNTCSTLEDYTTIIMEWTFHNSELIISQNLAKYDGELLCCKKPKRKRKVQKVVVPKVEPTDEKEMVEFINFIKELGKKLSIDDRRPEE